MFGGPLRRIAGELRKGSLGRPLAQHDRAFERDLALRRNLDLADRSQRHPERSPEEAAGNVVLVGINGTLPESRAERHQRMAADNNNDRQVPPEFLGAARIIPQVAPAVQTGSKQVPAFELHAVKAGVADAAVGIFRNDDPIGDIGAAVLGKVARDRQPSEIDIASG